MTPYVVDSSVAIKWFTSEVLSTEAIRLQTCGVPLVAPDFLDVELAAISRVPFSGFVLKPERCALMCSFQWTRAASKT